MLNGKNQKVYALCISLDIYIWLLRTY